MLKRFLFQTFSSFTGALVALAIGGVVMAVFLTGVISGFSGGSEEKKAELKKGSILMIDLKGEIDEFEKPFSPSLSMLTSGNLESSQTLRDISASIKEASKNKDIVALYLKCGNLSAGPATLDALRNEILEFKKNTKGEKKVFAYAEEFTQGCYYVASVADSVFMNPEGSLALRGFTVPGFYYKELLDKVGIKMQVAKVGTYKSAVEPYILDHMSEPARAQLDTMLCNLWVHVKTGISEARKGVTPAILDSLISRDNISFAPSELALKSNLIDGLLYSRQINQKLADISNCKMEDLNLVEPSVILKKTKSEDKNKNSKNQIAILYAVGDIADGNESQIDYNKYVPLINKLADEDGVKAMVLRVNSPGGSVYGSAQIGEALDYFKSKGKPIVVSMGDYAASGGYWISAKADKIYADPMTLTGSIGIFGMFPCVEDVTKKLGVNIDYVSTNPGAEFPNLFTALTDSQKEVLQKYIDRGYKQFVERVAAGRHISVEKVKKIAEGRVWDGMQAVKIGLVDELGGINEAIAWAAKKANVKDDYEMAVYPEYDPSLFDMIMNAGVTASTLKKAIQNHDTSVLENYMLNRIIERNPIQAHMGEYSIKL